MSDAMGHDEADEFTASEFEAASRIIADASDAHRWTQEMKQHREPDDRGPSWQLSPDLLDLLSLVSSACARRVAALLRLTPEDAMERRRLVAQRFGYNLDSEIQ